MKKKLFTILCAILLCFTTFMLSACFGGGSPSGGTGTNPPAGDSGSSGGNGNGGSSGGNTGGSTGGSDGGFDFEDAVQKPEPEPPQKGENESNSANFEDYFSGYRVLTEGDSNFAMFDDVTGTKQTFNYLLDRQITTLAQDILYRLYAVYGNEPYGKDSEGKSKEYVLNNLYGNITPAKVNWETLLTQQEIHNNLSHGIANRSVNIDCIFCYQDLINNNKANALNNNNFLILRNAIRGDFHYYDENLGLIDYNTEYFYDSDNDGTLDATKKYDPTPFLWKYSNGAESFDSWLNNYLNSFKMSIAKILVGDSENYLQDNYSENDYNNLLNRINRLGYFVKPEENSDASIKYDDEKVLDYIQKNIIGDNLIKENSDIYNTYTAEDKLLQIKFPNTLEGKNKHYYKGYNIVLPNIVKMAFSNTFSQTTKSLYPICLRTNIVEGTFKTKAEADPENGNPAEMTTTGPIKFNTLILKPKDGSLPNEFMLSVACARDSELGKKPGDIKDTRYIKDIYIKFKVNMAYVTTKGKGFNQIVKASHKEETLEIDSAGYVPKPPTIMGEPIGGEINVGYLPFQFSFAVTDYLDKPAPSFGEYNGSTATLDEMTLWNNAFVPNASNSAFSFKAGDNYLQISFVDVVVMQRTNSGDIVYTGNDVVYDISVMPLNF